MYGSLEKIVEETKKTGLPFWKVIQKEDCHEEDLSEEQAFLKMMTMYEIDIYILMLFFLKK